MNGQRRIGKPIELEGALHRSENLLAVVWPERCQVRAQSQCIPLELSVLVFGQIFGPVDLRYVGRPPHHCGAVIRDHNMLRLGNWCVILLTAADSPRDAVFGRRGAVPRAPPLKSCRVCRRLASPINSLDYFRGMKKYADDKYSLTSANRLDRGKSALRASSRNKKLNGSTGPSNRSVG